MRTWVMLLWREACFKVKTHKAHQRRSASGRWDVEKVHAIAARSKVQSQNAQSTPSSELFWKMRSRKSARRCSAKHMSKSKCWRHHMLRCRFVWQARRIACLVNSEHNVLKEVSENCIALDAINFDTWRSLAELLRLYICQVQESRIAVFWRSSSSKIEDVSQNSFVFKIADR